LNTLATPSFNVEKPLTKPKNRSKSLENEALSSKKITKLLEINPQPKSFLSLQASSEVKFEEKESGEGWWQIRVPNEA